MVPGRATWSLRGVHHEQRQAQRGWDTASTRQCYLFAASLPPHSATEQVSLKKKKSVHHRPPCVRGEIRHWRDQQTEEFKQRKSPWKWPHTAHNTRERARYIFNIFTIIPFFVFFFYRFLLMLLWSCFFFSLSSSSSFSFFPNFLKLLSPLFLL